MSQTTTEILLELVRASVKLALTRHCDALVSSETCSDAEIQIQVERYAADAVNAVQGLDTCAEEAIPEFTAAVAMVADLRQEIAEVWKTFVMRWDADMRAIKRWQAEQPGRELIWPDHVDLVLWLADERIGARKKALEDARNVAAGATYNGDYYSRATDAMDDGVRRAVSAIERLIEKENSRAS